MAVEFVDELKVFKPRDGAPSWVIANGELNGRRIVICESKSGKYYAKYDTYQPKQDQAETPRPTETEAEQGGDYARPPF